MSELMIGVVQNNFTALQTIMARSESTSDCF